MTYRWQGHFSGDPAAYRPEGELESWKAKDPILLAKAKLLERGSTEAELNAIHARVEKQITEYVKFAVESPSPDPKDGIKHVYMDIEVEGR
jgi:pyruvate dehydrogenase E1 component alpha subunit